VEEEGVNSVGYLCLIIREKGRLRKLNAKEKMQTKVDKRATRKTIETFIQKGGGKQRKARRLSCAIGWVHSPKKVTVTTGEWRENDRAGVPAERAQNTAKETLNL